MRNKITISKHLYLKIHRYCSSELLRSVLALCDIKITNDDDVSRWDIDYSIFEGIVSVENVLKVMIAFNEFCGGDIYRNSNLYSIANILIDLINDGKISEYYRFVVLNMITVHNIKNTRPFFNEVDGFTVPEESDDISFQPRQKFVAVCFSDIESYVFYYDGRKRAYRQGELFASFKDAKERAAKLNMENESLKLL